MSSTSSAELAASRSGSNELGCEPSPSAKSNPTQEVSSQSTGQACLVTTTFEPSPPPGLQPTASQSISSAAGSPARTSVRPGVVPVSMEPGAACGASSDASARRSGRNSRSSRMSRPFVVEALEEFLGIYPASGMTRNGQLFLRAQWVPHTHESVCSLWPTPRADGGNNAGGSNSRRAAIKRGTYITGKINPNHREWLMGFPRGWTEIDASAAPSSRRSRKSSAGR